MRKRPELSLRVEIDKASRVIVAPERALPVFRSCTAPVIKPFCWENTGLKVNKAAMIRRYLIVNFKVFKRY